MFERSLAPHRKRFHLTKCQTPIPFGSFLPIPRATTAEETLALPESQDLGICLLQTLPAHTHFDSAVSFHVFPPLRAFQVAYQYQLQSLCILFWSSAANPPRCHAQQAPGCCALPPLLMTQRLAGRAKPAATRLHASTGPSLFTAPHPKYNSFSIPVLLGKHPNSVGGTENAGSNWMGPGGEHAERNLAVLQWVGSVAVSGHN